MIIILEAYSRECFEPSFVSRVTRGSNRVGRVPLPLGLFALMVWLSGLAWLCVYVSVFEHTPIVHRGGISPLSVAQWYGVGRVASMGIRRPPCRPRGRTSLYVANLHY